MLLSDTIVDFHLFYDGAVDIQIWALLRRSQCKVSDTQVTVKACGPLVSFPVILAILSFANSRGGLDPPTSSPVWLKSDFCFEILISVHVITSLINLQNDFNLIWICQFQWKFGCYSIEEAGEFCEWPNGEIFFICTKAHSAWGLMLSYCTIN